MNEDLIFSVTELNCYVKDLLATNKNLNNVFLTGELSGITYSRQGHIYMTIKDETAAIGAVMFASDSSRLKFVLKDGQTVIAFGRASLYERDGSFKFYAAELRENGTGNLFKRFEELKEKLEKEGLFSSEYKKPIPKYPKKIGIVTSRTGAAIEDILNIANRRYKLADIYIYHSNVQGDGADISLAEGIKRLNKTDCDVIIIGRGGGSIEDLWQFNSELLAREIFRSSVPVVSAVGHETDFTICDFAADLRAPTPSAAAELITPDSKEIADNLNKAKLCLLNKMQNKIFLFERAIKAVSSKESFISPRYSFKLKAEKIKSLKYDINDKIKAKINIIKSEFIEKSAEIDAKSPLKTLSRGYLIAEKDNEIIRSKNDVTIGDSIKLNLIDGAITARVESVSGKAG